MRNISARVLTLVLALLLPPIAATPTQAALPVTPPGALQMAAPDASPHAQACTTSRDSPGTLAGATDFGCLPSERRIELLNRTPTRGVIAPLDRDFRQHRALHQWKAQEAAALAVPPADVSSLSSYLEARDIESRRSEALKETRQAILRSEARLFHLGAELDGATSATARWIQRQPGRAPPAAYLQRIKSAADALRAEELLLKQHGERRDDLNRNFDKQLQQVQPLQG